MIVFQLLKKHKVVTVLLAVFVAIVLAVAVLSTVGAPDGNTGDRTSIEQPLKLDDTPTSSEIDPYTGFSSKTVKRILPTSGPCSLLTAGSMPVIYEDYDMLRGNYPGSSTGVQIEGGTHGILLASPNMYKSFLALSGIETDSLNRTYAISRQSFESMAETEFVDRMANQFGLDVAEVKFYITPQACIDKGLSVQ